MNLKDLARSFCTRRSPALSGTPLFPYMLLALSGNSGNAASIHPAVILPRTNPPIGEFDGGIEEAPPFELAIVFGHGFPRVKVARRGDGFGATPVLRIVRRRRKENARI